MKNISTAALTQITTKLGGEPLVVVAIFWDGENRPPQYYCDRGAHQAVPQLQGKILKLANLDDVVNISNASNSQSVSITLSDTDGSIKTIYNTRDIHKKKVLIYQWFTQLNFNDKFVIFEGVINSPIVWVEVNRTMSFDIVSQLEDAEIGFSPEEGDFPQLDDSVIGKAWPMPFGTCLKVPSVSLDLVGNATLMDSIGLHDPKLEADLQNLFMAKQFSDAYAQALYTAGSVLQTNSAGMGEDVGPFEQNPDDPDYQQGQGMMDSATKLLNEGQRMLDSVSAITQQIEAQKKFEKDSVILFNGQSFPMGVPATFEIGELIVTGVISALPSSPRGDSILNITSITPKKPFLTHVEVGESSVEKYTSANVSDKSEFGFPDNFIADMGLVTEIDITKKAADKIIVDSNPGFVFVKAGTRIKWVSDLPMRWVAAMLPCAVLGVYAIRDYDGTKLMTAVPTNYYTVSYQNFVAGDGGPGVTATMITLKQPLSYINDIELVTADTGTGIVRTTTSSVNGQHVRDENKKTYFNLSRDSSFSSGWEDQIYVDLISPVGPNTADILQYLIHTYSGVPYPAAPFDCDTTSFNTVRAQLGAFPMHFCLFERKNLFDALKEIAFQARCAIWLKEDIFYLLYLVPEGAPVDSIDLCDIEEKTLEIHHTTTEELVTKFVASYKVFYGPQTGFAASDVGSKDNKIILRANMAKYGCHEQTYNYYAYTNTRLVDLSSTFWIIRKANTWKLVKFKTPLHKLRLETFDSVTIDLRAVSDEPVVGVVQSASLDSDAMEIDFSVWVPVRIGEMHKYPGANPDKFFFYPDINDEVGSQNVGETAGGDISSSGRPPADEPMEFEDGRDRPHDGSPNPGAEELNPIVSPEVENSIGELAEEKPDLYPPVNQNFDLSTNPQVVNTSAIPAKIRRVSNKGLPEYLLDSYPKGVGKKSVISKAIDASYDRDNPVKHEPGMWVMIQPLMWTDKVTTELPSTTSGDSTAGRRTQTTTKQSVQRYFLPTGGTSTYPGVVTGGSAGTYTVNIYKSGLTGAATSVTVKQLQIAGGESIPSGTWALVSKGPSGEYTMQVPVWL
jgi:hypothetical protein